MKWCLGSFALILSILASCRTPHSDTSDAAAVNWPRIKDFPPPPKVSWKPKDIRHSHEWPELLPQPSAFRAFHADQRNTNQTTSAYAPMFKKGWVAETNLYIPEGPSFDEEGHVYVVPIRPPVDVQLVSLDRKTGQRRFAIPGKRAGQGGAPLVLKDPEHPKKDIIYYGSYEFLTAVSSDGKVLWDVPTGLKAPADAKQIDIHNFGVNYLSRYDALVSSMGDGSLVVHDRATGRPLMKEAFVLPGAKSTAKQTSALSSLPQALMDHVNQQLAPLFEAPPPGKKSRALEDLIAAILGGGAKVANYFGIDPTTGRMWVASTAPDEADGKKDGASEFGAIYGLDFVKGEGFGSIVVHCSKAFAGGSASSPSLRADGKRIYFADAFNKVIGIDDDCRDVWSVDVGTQILGSLATSDNNGEIYAAGAQDIIKIVEEGHGARIAWKSSTDMFETPLGVLKSGNLNLAGIGANGVVIHAGAGVKFRGHVLPTQVGLVLLDRTTGKVLYGASGREESIAAMSSSSDGAVYLAHSPIRRALAHAVSGSITETVIGGVGKYEPIRLDLLARDASCAAQFRAENMKRWQGDMPKAAIDLDVASIVSLTGQAREAAAQAARDGDLEAAQLRGFTDSLAAVENLLEANDISRLIEQLSRACALVD
jgi:hypothetical protein